MVFAVVAATGCDTMNRNEARFSFVLTGLDGGVDAAALDGCATSIQSVVFRVNDRTYFEDVSSDTVLFRVSDLPRGELRADAAVLSNTGDTLFVGEDRRTVDEKDFGTIDIRLRKLRPVLEVCPDTLSLFADDGYSDTLSVVNRDARPTDTLADTLHWRAVESRVCMNGECVFVEPASGTAIVPHPDRVFVGGGFAPAGTVFAFPFESSSGRVTVYVRVSGKVGN